MPRINPLFEIKSFEPVESFNITPKLYKNKAMIKATCAGIPCWVDLESRIVIPVDEN